MGGERRRRKGRSARKGSGNFHLIVSGKAAHAGRAFDEGRNAVAGAAMVAAALHGLNGQREGGACNRRCLGIQ